MEAKRSIPNHILRLSIAASGRGPRRVDCRRYDRSDGAIETDHDGIIPNNLTETD